MAVGIVSNTQAALLGSRQAAAQFPGIDVILESLPAGDENHRYLFVKARAEGGVAVDVDLCKGQAGIAQDLLGVVAEVAAGARIEDYFRCRHKARPGISGRNGNNYSGWSAPDAETRWSAATPR